MNVRARAAGATATLVGALALLAGATAGDGRCVDRMLASMGEPYFEAYCAPCHGPSGRGDGPAAKESKTPAVDLTRIAARRGGAFPDGEIAKFIDGRFDTVDGAARDMPVWGRRLAENVPEAGVGESLARGKIAMLVEYLKSIQSGETAEDIRD